MRRKVFSLMMMLLLAVTGFVRAEIVEIGDGTSDTYYVPFNSLYNYSFTEQVFLASEIGTAGSITSISFYLNRSNTVAQTNDVVLYMKNVTRETFASNTDFEPVTAADVVFNGQWTIPADYTGWVVLDLDTPFAYDGSSNLMIAMDENTGTYSTRYFAYTSVANSHIQGYSDSYNPDPYDMASYSGSKVVRAYRANIQLDITAGGGGGGVPGELTVYDGTATSSYVPVYGFYADAYLKAEFVMPAEELAEMAGGTINSMKFYASSPAAEAWTSTFQVFVKEVSDAAISAYYGPEGATVVYEGLLNGTGDEMTINFSAPYQYNGGNLLIGVYNITKGNYKSVTWAGESVSGASLQGYSYNSLGEVTVNQRNFLPKTTFGYISGGGGTGPALVTEPAVLDLGFRPNGAWMRPYEAMLTAVSGTHQVTDLDVTNPYFQLTAQVPAVVNNQHNLEFTVDHGTAAEGPVNGELVAMTAGRGAYIFPITATAYNPIANDVVETANTAITFNNGYFSATVGEGMYDNYLLPGDAEDGKDVVYKMVLPQERLFMANVEGENGKWAVYTDFNGEPGPGVDNYYTGPTIGEGGGMTGGAFEVQIGEGTSTTGYFPFYTLYNYCIAENLFRADELSAAGLTSSPLSSLSWYATNDPGYAVKGVKIWMANVSDTELTTTSHTVTGMTLVCDYPGEFMIPIGWYQFDFNTGNSFAWDGHSNILIFVQRNQGEWHSTIQWQASTTSFVAQSYRYQDSGAYDVTVPNTMYTASTRPNIIFKSGRDRDQVAFTFEGGLQGWTSIDADGDGHGWLYSDDNEGGYDYTGYAHGGQGFAMSASFVDYVGPFDADNYLVSPQKYALADGANIQFFADYANDSYPDYFEVCVSTAATPSASSFTAVWSGTAKDNGNKASVRHTGMNRIENWRLHNVDLSAYAGQEVWIAFHHEDYDNYEIWIDDVTINTGNGGGGNTGGDPQWELGQPLTLLPGTYYLVASSTDDTFEVQAMLAELPLPIQASEPSPADMATGVTSPLTLHWTLGEYTTEYRVLFGTTYPPAVVVDWTSNLAESLNVGILLNNKNYFWRVDERNSTGETLGQLWGFTTALNVPQNLTAVAEKIYEGDVLTLNWANVNDRSFRGYNVYQDGVKINNTVVTTNTYTVNGLTYNMTPGYTYNVTAVYDEGESAMSGDLVAFVTGKGSVNGHVYEQDGTTPIAGATVTFTGVDEYMRPATASFTTNASGAYNGAILAGSYTAIATISGYQDTYYPATVNIVYNTATNDIDFFIYENWNPVAEVIAEEISADIVKVYWSQNIMSEIVDDFETGDFTKFDWQNDPTYPWQVTTNSPYEGTYCIMSGNYNVASSTSAIEVSVEIPRDGLMSFFGKISCESSWDYGYFYIDGTEKASFTGAGSWVEKEFAITEGVHTFRWAYTKDSSVNSNDDRFYVDYVSFFHQAEPTPPGMITYDFEDGTLQGWTTIDADGDGHNWANATSLMSGVAGHNGSNDFVFSQSYDNTYGVLYPDNYLVSPQITLGGNFIFYACAQDNAYAAEHFGVAVSTTTATASAFTTIQEWTMTAKGQGVPCNHTRSGNRTQGNWYQYTVDLSSYAGQTGYVAIRHFNCSDMFYLDVDDIMLNNGAKGYDFTAETINSVSPVVNKYQSRRYRDRSFNHYNVYRANCYDETGEDAELIAEVVDTVYMDVAWPTLAPGVYKWGVSRVYEGNRESAINWITPKTINAGTFSSVEGIGTVGEMNNRDGWVTYATETNSNNIGASGEFWWGVMFPAGSYQGNSVTKVSTFDSGYPFSGDVTVYNDGTDAPSNAVGTMAVTVDGDASGYEDFTFSSPVSIDASKNLWIVFHNVTSTSYPAAGSEDIGNPNGRWVSLDGTSWDDLASYGINCTWQIRAYLENGGTPPTPPTPPTPGTFGESDIVWSNCLDHNMYQQVSLSVSTNSGDAVTGAQVSLVNLSEPEMAIAYNVELDESGYYVWDNFRRGEYQLSITLDGFTPVNEVVDLFNNNSLVYVLEEVIGNLEDLYVSATGWVKMGDITPGGSVTPPVGPGSTFSENFDAGMPAGWTTIDADGDGLTWVSSMNPGIYHNSGVNLSGTGHNASEAYVISGSYANQTGQVLYPDNYLVSPQVNLAAGSVFSFWACAQDASYAAEHYGVSVSDNGTDWTLVQEWTMTAKDGGHVMSVGRNGNTRVQGNWYQKTVDLSAYAGQKYIAIRHFNCYDQFILNVDDVELTSGSKNVQQYLVRLDGALDGVTTNPFFQHNVEGLVPGSTHTTSVKAVYGTGESDWAEFEWVYTPCDEFAGLVEEPYGEYDGNDVVLHWVLPESTGPVNPPAGQGFSVDFESGMPEGWTVVDANNDGWTWCLTSAIPTTWTYYASLTLDWYHGGSNAICSGSYINGVGALNPDEYLISNQVTLGAGSQLSFWVAATDASYPADHFGVFVSTTGTNPSDFTSVQEWTLTGKKEGMVGGAASREGKGLRLGTWYNYTVDLSGYAGNAYIAFRHFNCYDQYIMCLDDITLGTAKNNRGPWDLMMTFTAAEGGQYGVAYDGNNFYTSNWGYSGATYNFFKYDLQGNMLEGFNISGCGTLRGMTYDGEFFYGVANSSTVYVVDLANQAVVNTFTSSYGAMRGITYDPERDGFWVIGNWSGNLTLIDHNGTVQFTGPAPTSASDLAYYKDENDVEHVFCFNNGTNDVEDYNITTNTMGGSVFNFSNTPGYDAGSSGGCTVAAFNGKMAFIGDLQQSPNLIGIYELRDDNSGPVPPVPPVEGGIIGVEIFRNGEWIAEVPYTENSYVDVNPGNVDEYTIRVVHDGLTSDYTYYAMSCPEVVNLGGPVCDAPENLTGDYFWTPTAYGATITWTYGEQPIPPAAFEWYYYDNGVNEDAIGTGGGQFWWGVMFPAGSYQGGQVTKVAAYDYRAMTGNVTLYNDGTNAPANAVGTANVTFTGSNDFVEFTFANPVNIDPSKNLWVVFYNESGTDYPAAVCANTGDANGRWVSLDGATWEDLASYSLDYTFMVRAYIGGSKGEVSILSETPAVVESTGTFSNAGEGFGPAASASAIDNVMAGDPVSFNVYRDGNVIANVPFTGAYEYSYNDQPGVGSYDYQVTAVYDGCESEPALVPGGGANYVTVDVTAVNESSVNARVYPNPTNGNVMIEAAGMNHLTVVSTLGQILFDADVDADQFEMNLGQYKAGVYMVRINTENGVSVKRVTVVE